MEQKKRKKVKVKRPKKTKKEKPSKKLKKEDANSNVGKTEEAPTNGVGKLKRKRSQSESPAKKIKKPKKEKPSKKLKKEDVNSNVGKTEEAPMNGVKKMKRKRPQREPPAKKIKIPKLQGLKATLSNGQQIQSFLPHPHLKMEYLEKTLLSHLPKGRGVICTSNSETAQTLTMNLLATGYSASCVRNPSLTPLSQQIVRCFHDSQKNILVTTDSLLEQLEITSAHWLLYFDPPKNFLQTFPKWTPMAVTTFLEHKSLE